MKNSKQWLTCRRLLRLLFFTFTLICLTLRSIFWYHLSDHLNHHKQKQQVKENYVVISTTITETAREEDYAYVLPLAAITWSNQGYIPLIAAVGTNQSAIDEIMHVWDILLPKNAKVMPIIGSNTEQTITIAQVLRLYASYIWPELHNESFLRVTEADMLVLDPDAFAPIPDGSSVDITIYNGNAYPRPSSNDTCRQYPMHSVGMKVGLWRDLLPMKLGVSNKADSESLEAFINREVIRIFPEYATSGKITHSANRIWSADQEILGCVIDRVIDTGSYEVQLTEGPTNRMHIWDTPSITDVHLAKFNLKENEVWLNGMLSSTSIISGREERYRKYINAWKQFHSLAF